MHLSSKGKHGLKMIGWKGNIPSETMQKFFQAN
jgi:hypothetical protein